jgi:hypothetical protein
MCNGFGAIVTQDAVYFCEPDKDGDIGHSEILNRLGWSENADPFIRHFVRVECSNWKLDSFRFDENETLPGWVDEESCRERVAMVLARCAPAWAAYDAVQAPALAAYEAARDQALAAYDAVQAQALAAYEAVRAPAWAAYKAAQAPALAAYEAVRAPAWAAYEAVQAPAWAAYDAVQAPALAAYEAAQAQALADMINKLSTIAGYVPTRIQEEPA